MRVVAVMAFVAFRLRFKFDRKVRLPRNAVLLKPVMAFGKFVKIRNDL